MKNINRSNLNELFKKWELIKPNDFTVITYDEAIQIMNNIDWVTAWNNYRNIMRSWDFLDYRITSKNLNENDRVDKNISEFNKYSDSWKVLY